MTAVLIISLSFNVALAIALTTLIALRYASKTQIEGLMQRLDSIEKSLHEPKLVVTKEPNNVP